MNYWFVTFPHIYDLCKCKQVLLFFFPNKKDKITKQQKYLLWRFWVRWVVVLEDTPTVWPTSPPQSHTNMHAQRPLISWRVQPENGCMWFSSHHCHSCVSEVSDCALVTLFGVGSVTKESLRCGHVERTDEGTMSFPKMVNERLKVVFYRP